MSACLLGNAKCLVVVAAVTGTDWLSPTSPQKGHGLVDDVPNGIPACWTGFEWKVAGKGGGVNSRQCLGDGGACAMLAGSGGGAVWTPAWLGGAASVAQGLGRPQRHTS